jgi:hypothetical protein
VTILFRSYDPQLDGHTASVHTPNSRSSLGLERYLTRCVYQLWAIIFVVFKQHNTLSRDWSSAHPMILTEFGMFSCSLLHSSVSSLHSIWRTCIGPNVGTLPSLDFTHYEFLYGLGIPFFPLSLEASEQAAARPDLYLGAWGAQRSISSPILAVPRPNFEVHASTQAAPAAKDVGNPPKPQMSTTARPRTLRELSFRTSGS